jgi:hypothetical protein
LEKPVPPGGSEPWTDSGIVEKKREERYFCARCHRLITDGRERLSMNGAHEHTVFNPAGLIFEILCFAEAPGVTAVGEPSGEFTWFKNYVWRLALCLGCERHLGWQFSGAGTPAVFHGLIANRLTREEDGGEG